MNTFREYESNQLDETAIVFGEHQNLVGVAAKPSAPSTSSDFAILILTAGMLPSSGPFRLHADLARSLANEKLPSLRFDLSGIGESLAVSSKITTSFAKSSDHVAFLLEHRAALVQLATKHFKTVDEGMRLRSSQTLVQAI